ncbi:MAG: RNA recognition motif domain-containing protein [Thiohalocapsa sp.]
MWVRNNKGNVFVGNLPPDFSDERLAETFDPYGIVLSAAIARDPATGARLRYGFVDIATEKAMTKAIAALHGSEVDGCKLNVKPRERAPAKKTAGPRSSPRPIANRLRREAPEAPARRPGAAFARAASEPPVAREATERPRLSVPPASAAPAPSQSSQSQRALEGLPEIEPPPRRDFEVVRRPLRRGAPSFQVERRPLPRRV